MSYFQLIRRQKGISIVEIMVGLTISLLLVAAASTIWLSSKASFEIQNDLAEIQDAGRFATTWLQRNLREAGFLGCAGANNSEIMVNQVSSSEVASNLMDLDNMLEGREKGSSSWQSSNSNWLPSSESNLDDTIGALSGATEMENGTDAFTIRGFNFEGFGVVSSLTPSSSSITLETSPNLKANQIVAVINCGGGTVFQVGSNTNSTSVDIKSSDSLTRIFEGESLDSGGDSLDPKHFPSYLYKYQAYRYYIRPYHATNNSLGPSLWRVSLNTSGTAVNEEVLPGVENMQVLYGEDPGGDGTPNTYRKAPNVAHWDAVVSIKIGLLIRSLEQYGSDKDSSSHQVLDELIPALNDRRRRKVFVTEIAIRNRQ